MCECGGVCVCYLLLCCSVCCRPRVFVVVIWSALDVSLLAWVVSAVTVVAAAALHQQTEFNIVDMIHFRYIFVAPRNF